MFALDTHAAAIVVLLDNITTVKTAAYLDNKTQSHEYPATYPAAFVAVDKINNIVPKNNKIKALATWVVLVRGKRFDGDKGLLAVVDDVLDALVDAKPVTGERPLALVDVRFNDITAEAAEYAIRLSTTATVQLRGC